MEEEIKKLLQSQRDPDEHRGWSCPDEIRLAAYVDQNLSGSERNSVEAHIADCNFCLDQVAFLTKSSAWQDAEEIPAGLLSKARNLVRGKRGKAVNWGWRWAVASAAFTGLVLLVGVVALQRRGRELLPTDQTLVAKNSPTPAEPVPIVEPSTLRPKPTPDKQIPKAKSQQPSEVRSDPSAALLPKLLSPRDGAAVKREDLEFRWAPITEAIFYDLRITTAEGDVVFEEQTEDTVLKPGSVASLIPGTKYFATIRAHLPSGKTVNSGVMSFRLATP